MPVYFRHLADADEYVIEWKWAGTLDYHSVDVPKQDGGVHCYQFPCDKHYDIPETAESVISRLVKPLSYPMECPEITKELLEMPEKKGHGWLKNMRVAFIDGLRDGTIPLRLTGISFNELLF